MPTLAPYLREVVHPRELEQRGDAVAEGADDEPVEGGGVVDLGQVGAAVQGDCGQGEDGGDPQPHSIWRGLTIQPEAHPRQDHEQGTRQVDLDQEVSRVTLKTDHHLKDRIGLSCWGDDDINNRFGIIIFFKNIFLDREGGKILKKKSKRESKS